MTRKFKISRKNASLMAVFLLVGYLMLLLSVTYTEQERLSKSQLNELDLKVANYATSLNYFFNAVKEDIDSLSKHKTIYTFFANLSSGMSMKYGLGSSLFQLKNRITQETLPNLQHNSESLFKRLILVGLNSNVIADSHPKKPLNIGKAQLNKNSTLKQKVYAFNNNGQVTIHIIQNVYYNSELIGYMIGMINNDVIYGLLSNQKKSTQKSRLTIHTEQGPLELWSSLQKLDLKSEISNEKVNYLTKPINGTPFYLNAWFESLSEQQIITSTWLTAALAFLALPVGFGLLYSLDISNKNLVLQTKIEQTGKQQQTLTSQNHRLKDEINRRKESELELAHQASHDALTGVSNRKSGNEKLHHMLIQAKRNKQNVLLMFIDLDNFKQINDTLGHLAGDEIIKQTADRLKQSVRESDIVARFGGDEFLLAIPELASDNEAKQFASKLLQIFEQPFHIQNTEFFISTSIGMAIYPQDGNNADTLLAHADTAMYRVKDQGRNGFHFYDQSMNKDVQRNIEIDARLRQAIANKQIEIYYQPIINLANRQITGAEALMRWTDEKLGFVSPEEFIPIAEKNSLIHKLGEIALTKACGQTALWHEIKPLSIAVNFSSVQFRRPEELLKTIKNALNESGLDAKYLDVEITEGLLFYHNTETHDLIKNLKSLGAQLSIDDFGTGYSALSYLQQFPFDKLKIDRSFLQSMQKNLASRELVNAIIAMAKALSLKVVAEGVETQWDQDYLCEHECEFAQGYYYSRPLPAEEFEKLLKSQVGLDS